MNLDELLKRARAEGADDLHLAAGSPPRIRLRGELDPIPGAPPIVAAELDAALAGILSAAERASLAAENDVEVTFGLPGVARVRGTIFRSTAGLAAVFRVVPEPPAAFATLGLPPAFEALLGKRSGLILLAVPSGSGRSTLLASVVDKIAATGGRFVATIEDAVEVLITRGPGAPVLQRQVGREAETFADAIDAAARMDVEVIVAADLPDRASLFAALAAAEAGKLVIAVAPIPGAARALERLVDLMPAMHQAETRRLLASNLLGVLSQVLLRRTPGGLAPGDSPRVAAHELLLVNAEIVTSLTDGEIGVITGQIEAGKGVGMVALDDSIAALVARAQVLPEEALRRANDKSRFSTRA